MKEKYQYIGGQSAQHYKLLPTWKISSGQNSQPANQLQMTAWLTISFMLIVLIISGVIMGLLYTDNANLHHRLDVLEGEMLVMRDLVSQVRPLRCERLQTRQ